MNRSALRRFLLGLAFVAAGMLTVAPSISRLVAQHDHGRWTALCSASGLKWIHLAASDGHPAPDSTHHHDGVDCDYCLLLGQANTPPPMLASAPLRPTPHASLPIASARQRIEYEPRTGLGSRGPPQPTLPA